MSSRRVRLIGIGVDLVDPERAGRLLRLHPGGVDRFLNRSEARLLRSARQKTLAFALMFAAKEAASKSVGQTLSGPGSFKDFKVNKNGARLTVDWKRRVRIDLVPFTWNRLAGMLAYSYNRL